MEINGTKMGLPQLQTKSLPILSQKNSAQTQSLPKDEISLYSGELTIQCIISNVARVRKAFPALPTDYFDVLTDMIREYGFSDSRFNDAVKNVIATCVYPTPTIANFISWDRTFKILSYEEMIKKADEFGPKIWDSYRAVQFKNREKKVWVHVDDVKMYNLIDEV